MKKHDVLVVGGGISGLAFASAAARAGRSALVLEKAARAGGCLASHRAGSGYWFELGAHTCYNSYASVVGLVDACGLREELLRRVPTHLRFLDGDRLVPGSNLLALLRLFSWGELAVSFPRVLREKKDGQSVAAYYSRIVGARNYETVLGPMLSAVPSQRADAFPAGMLFKRRASRREDTPRSFTLRGGLSTLAEALARQPGVAVEAGTAATRVERTPEGYAVTTADGSRHEASVLALATSPAAAARLLGGAAPELAARVATVREATVDTVGVAVRAEKVRLPVSMFLVPRRDVFHSVVSRDSVPDPSWRAFSFHFKPGLGEEERLERITRLLRLERSDLAEVAERTSVLPSPVVGHEAVVADVDRLTAGSRLAVLGNWFAGLSLEDCVERSLSEWSRVA